MNNLEARKDSILLESGTNEVEIIEFYLGSNSYGINVSKVQRVIARSNVTITRAADAPAAVLGSVHILGKPVALINLSQALGLQQEAGEINEQRQLILVTTFNSVTTAFLIDGISKIHRTSWEHFDPISDKLGDENGSGYATGTITLNESITIILDLERLLIDFFPKAHAHSIESVRVKYRSGRESVHLIYAEDSKMVRTLTLRVLNEAGYTNIETFENGLEALNRLDAITKEAQAEGDWLCDKVPLVLTDIEMPRMDGLTLCRRIKSDLSPQGAPKVIVYSSLINKEMIAKCQSVGVDAQLAKPEIERIVELVDEFCLDSED